MAVSSGIRWYRTLPSQLTQTVVASQSALWKGGDPVSSYPYASITQVAAFTGQQAAPVSFASAFDPALNSGAGGDILVVCGFTSNLGFATQNFTFSGTPTSGQTVTVAMVGPSTVSVSYTTISSDNVQSVAKQISTLVNQSAAVAPTTPFLASTAWYSPTQGSSIVTFGALTAGAGGNTITVHITITGSGLTVSPSATTNLSGGGSQVSSPLKYDGANVTGLSPSITQAFTNCVSWHNHVWYWGDPANPDTLYASDIDQPEGWQFMLQNGGYLIGAGDGDPGIRAVVPAGNILYVFKSNSIFAITGYDFQTGEYEFQVQPAIQGTGCPNAQSVAVVKNQLVFWSGSSFFRLAPGAFTLEYIGAPIPVTQGQIQQGNQALFRAVGGDFIYQSRLNESYTSLAGPALEMYSSVALFAYDTGGGVADTIAVFDDDASAYLGKYAWSVWSGWQVEGWIPFGGGPSSAGAPEEQKLLCWCSPATLGGPNIHAYGTDPAADSGLAISWLAQTGWVTLGTSALQKNLHRLFLELESTSGVFISFTVTPDILVRQNGQTNNYSSQSASFGATGAIAGAEAHQVLLAELSPYLPGGAWVFGFGENTATSNFEIVELTLDTISEPFRP